MNELCPMPGCRVERITREGSDLLCVAARGTRPGGRCPDCGDASRTVHSRYRRRVADLPSLGRQVRVGLQVRRFYCRNPACARRTFAERLPELVAPRARRTLRLAGAQARLGAALGGEVGARVLPRLAMPVSADTVLRLVRGLPMPEPEPPRAVVVDDWAMRKGRTYGTIVVDLDRRRVVDLLPDRTAETLADWLRQRPGVQVIARDRSTEYARGVAMGAPDAVQVCDRWHLLANVRQAVERWLHTTHARLRRLPGPPAGAGTTLDPPRRDQAFRRNGPERAARAERRARWQVRYDEVRRRHLAGEPLLSIARATGLARATVRKYARAESFPARLPHGPGPSILDPYLPYLERRLTEGCENGLALWRELRAQGFPGGNKQVHRWLAERRAAPARVGRRRNQDPDDAQTAAARDEGSPLPAPRQLAWALVQPAAALGVADAAVLARIEQDGEAKIVAGLARRFAALVRACGVGGRQEGGDPAEPTAELDAWLAEARACGVPAIETFATGLEADGAAVRAALTEPWSSGQAEGQVNRLKLLKRQSYGRAGFDLLRRRVLLAA
ncbi:MAG: ISL3 family transposase [Caulobacteraceae bacterium]|nr:ISL3 family transposase [Caulobacteraceae bacterium]